MKGSLDYIINKNLKNWRNPIFLSWKIIKKCVLHGKGYPNFLGGSNLGGNLGDNNEK